MAGRNVLKSIGKGELFWAAMAMSAATCYELYSLQEILTSPNERGLAWAAFWIHEFIILFSVIFVGIGSLSTAPSSSANPYVPDPTVFWASIGTLIFTILTYTVSHTVLTVQEEKLRIETDRATQKDRQAIIDRAKECLSKDNAVRCVEEMR